MPNVGGIEKHLFRVVQEMLLDEHKVEVLTFTTDVELEKIEVDDRFTIRRIAHNGDKRRRSIQHITKNLRQILSFDIIHVHDHTSFILVILPILPLLKLMNIPVYITFHGWEGIYPPPKKIIFKRKVVNFLASGNICVGHFIEKWYGTKADQVIYGGCDVDASLPAESTPSDNDVVFIGRLASDTGIWIYLKAWQTLKLKYGNRYKKFYICGGGTELAALKHFVENNKIQGVIFTGFVENINRYLAKSSTILTSGYLGILEALALEKKVIATYDNLLKKDYLDLMPGADDMYWICKNVDEVVFALIDEQQSRSKIINGKKFAILNSWRHVKSVYYRLWGNNGS